jgi:hypothetical protein
MKLSASGAKVSVAIIPVELCRTGVLQRARFIITSGGIVLDTVRSSAGSAIREDVDVPAVPSASRVWTNC